MTHFPKLEPLGDWGQEQRKQFHAAFNCWVANSSEQEYLRLMAKSALQSNWSVRALLARIFRACCRRVWFNYCKRGICCRLHSPRHLPQDR